MQLIDKKDPILNNKCEPFDFANPPFDPVEFAEHLIKFMYEKNGLGLSANQVGIPYRIFCMRGSPKNFVCYNPKIVDSSDEEVVLEEGCLSFPNLLVKIKRPRHIRVRFQYPNGETVTEKFTGMTARVFQHELDHMDGEIFYKKANKFHRDRALKKWKYGGV